MEFLAGDIFGEIEGERGFIIERAEAAGRAFEMESDFGIGFISCADGGEDLGAFETVALAVPAVAAQDLHVVGGDFDFEAGEIRGDGSDGRAEDGRRTAIPALFIDAILSAEPGGLDGFRIDEVADAQDDAEGQPDRGTGNSARGRIFVAAWFHNGHE